MKKAPAPKGIDTIDVTATVKTALSKQEQKVLENSTVAKPAISTPTDTKDTPESKQSKSGDVGHNYCYTLVTPQQRKEIDLLKSKAKLEKLFKSFFGERLISVKIESDNYSLELTDEFKVGEKRMLGRQVGMIDDMKKHAKKVYYNNGQDHSTQLFKIKPIGSNDLGH